MVEMKHFWRRNREQRYHIEDTRCGWKDNIKMERNEIVFDDMDWDHLAMDGEKCRAVVSMATNPLVP